MRQVKEHVHRCVTCSQNQNGCIAWQAIHALEIPCIYYQITFLRPERYWKAWRLMPQGQDHMLCSQALAR